MLPIIIILGIAGAVWTAILVMRGSLLAGCLVFLIASACLGTEFAQFKVAGINLSIDRLFLLGLVAAAMVQWRLGRLQPVKLTRIDGLLFALVGLLVVSTFTHNWHYDPVRDEHIVQHLLNGYIIPLLLYLIVRQAPLDERRWSLLIGGMAGFGVYLALVGLAEAAEAWSLVFPRYIADPKIGTHFGRARGPMVHSVTYGMVLASCMVAGWLWHSRLSRRWSIVLLALMPLFPLAIYFTKTRSVWLGAASALLLIVALTLRGRTRTVVLASMMAAGLLLAVTKMDTFMGLKREGTVAHTRQSASMRPSFVFVSWQMFLDRPLLGVGFGQFPREKLPYLNDRTTALQLQQIRPYAHHNTFLSILTETGLVGFSLFIALYLAWLRTGWCLVRDSRAPSWMNAHGLLLLCVVVITGWQMLGHDITFTPLINSFLFLTAALGIRMRQSIAEPSISSAAPDLHRSLAPAQA